MGDNFERDNLTDDKVSRDTMTQLSSSWNELLTDFGSASEGDVEVKDLSDLGLGDDLDFLSFDTSISILLLSSSDALSGNEKRKVSREYSSSKSSFIQGQRPSSFSHGFEYQPEPT